jgi:hypothetical protein
VVAGTVVKVVSSRIKSYQHQQEGMMADVLKEFTNSVPPYPWDDWTNGSVWRVHQGDDFQCSPRSFRTYLFAKAKALGMKVTTAIVSSPVGVEFQFTKEGS